MEIAAPEPQRQQQHQSTEKQAQADPNHDVGRDLHGKARCNASKRLTTTGAQAEAVEKLVEVIRHHYGLPTQDHLKPDGVSKCIVSSPDESEFVGC